MFAGDQAIPADICQQILQEIFDISFRMELLMLDRYLYIPQEDLNDSNDDTTLTGDELDATSREDRNLKVSSKLFSDSTPFTSADFAIRRNTLYVFYKVMRSWEVGGRARSMAHESIEKAETLGRSNTMTWKELEKIEYHLAYFYITTFADFFKRAPVLPHFL